MIKSTGNDFRFDINEIETAVIKALQLAFKWRIFVIFCAVLLIGITFVIMYTGNWNLPYVFFFCAELIYFEIGVRRFHSTMDIADDIFSELVYAIIMNKQKFL